MASYHLKFDGPASAAVDFCLEYSRIVHGDDGGTPFTPKQYEAYKKRVAPMRLNKRVYVCWTNQNGIDCKLVGPETPCFCQHRFHEHKTDFEELPSQRPVAMPCQSRGCGCQGYHYTPMMGTKCVRCRCRHLPEEHSAKEPYGCRSGGCKCGCFTTSYTCGCGNSAATHCLITETKSERKARGHPVGQDTMYKAMGGITGFASLMDGYMRLDDSGLGAPDEAFLNQPITSSDHPFLRANVESIHAHKLASGAPGVDDDLAERMSAMRRPGETDMEYFERRYQERQKAQRLAARGTKPAIRTSGGSSSKKPSPPKHYDNTGLGLHVGGASLSSQKPNSQVHNKQTGKCNPSQK